ncbi:ABC transporter ATP-binding protein [Mesorhizobium delmotii]|uniref:Nickel import system ATP-binding protein NikD n=1 Tax=Mesorhizobium delmotii TaxID=1631247 RepID=A0A2P9AGA8_9HYPH|nr:ABC transporter ATP-binding protein [Mesorhizobium delmotii]SJM30144.1 ABC transporter [Mesorhizobium delmotii]
MTALIEVHGLKVEVGRAEGTTVPVLSGIDLAIASGEVVAAIGASGSGKSTLGLALAGYTRPGARVTAGRILFEGRDLLTLPGRELRKMRGGEIAFVPQSAAAGFNPALTITQQVAEPAIASGLNVREARQLAQRLYGELGLPDPRGFGDHYPHQVSGGQLQRAAAAMAFAGRPKLIVFDEPTTALDVTTQVGVLAAFRDHIRRSNVAAFYISHDLAVVAQLADRIVVLEQGRIVDEGSVSAILGGRSRAASTPKKAAPTAVPAEPLLAVRNLTVRYPRQIRHAIADLTFDIGQGEIVGVVGESGSGKSTLGRVLSGLVTPQSGEITFGGLAVSADVRRRPRDLQRRIQIAFQSADVALNPRQRIRDILGRPMTLFRKLDGRGRDSEIAALLELVELPSDLAGRFPCQLSGGQKQRVNLARALAAEPDLLICDEVTSALDEPLREAIIDLLRRLNEKRRLAMLFVTHDLSTIADFADRLVVLQQGRIVETGPARHLIERPQHPYSAELVHSIPQPDSGWLDVALVRRAANLRATADGRTDALSAQTRTHGKIITIPGENYERIDG